MAAELCAELRFRDGQRQSLRVQTGVQTGNRIGTVAIGSLIPVVRELSHNVTCLLTELVQREQGQGSGPAELDEEDEENEEDENEEDPSDFEPEPKRTKPETRNP